MPPKKRRSSKSTTKAENNGACVDSSGGAGADATVDPSVDPSSTILNDPCVDDYPTRPFFGVDRQKEESYDNMYGCAFNPYIPSHQDQLAVVVGGENLILFKCPVAEKKLIRLGKQKVASQEELWTCTWAYDWQDKEKEHKVVCAGQTGVIYVVDTSTLIVDRELVGHGKSVNDVRACPNDFGLFASASFDHSIRVWHIREETCLLIFGTRQVLMDQVASVDWSPDTQKLISCGFNHRVMCWNLQEPLIQEHMRECQRRIDLGIPVGPVELRDVSENLQMQETVFNLEGHSLICTKPEYIIGDIHFQSVDSLRAVNLGNRLYVISKSTGNESTLALWRFGTLQATEQIVRESAKKNHVSLWKKYIDGGHPWFVKLALDPKKKWVAVGATAGRVHFFDMRDRKKLKPDLTVTADWDQSIIRQVDFSPDGSMILAVGDAGYVGRLDRAPATLVKKPKDIWKIRRRSLHQEEELYI